MLPVQDAVSARLPNTAIGELLCLAADQPKRTAQQRRALRRAGRAAFRWPVEASELVAKGSSLTELRFVGPWLASLIRQWIRDIPRVPAPPLIRRDFLSRTESTGFSKAHLFGKEFAEISRRTPVEATVRPLFATWP
jgi:hypothetical protein